MLRGEQFSRADAVRGATLCVGLVLCAVVYSFHLESFLDAKEAVLWLAVCVAAGAALAHRNRIGQSMADGVRAFAPVWVLLAGSLAIHFIGRRAAVPSDAVEDAARFALLLLAAALSFDLLSDETWRKRFLDAMVLAGIAVAVLGLAQYAAVIPHLFPEFPGYSQPMYSVFGNQDLLGGYLAIVLPILAHRFVSRGKPDVPSLAGFILTAVVLLLSQCRSAWLAAAIGVAIALAFADRQAGRVWALAGLSLLLISLVAVLAPSAVAHRVASTLEFNDVGIRARLWFWDGTLRMIRAHPLAGVGLGNYAYWSPRFLGEALHGGGGGVLFRGAAHYHNELRTLHAHSEPLEIAAETGVFGVACCAWMGWRLFRCRGWEWGPLAALLVFSLSSFPFHSAPHAFVGVLLVSMAIARRSRVETTHPGTGRAGSVAKVAGFGVPVAFAVLALFALWSGTLWSYRLREADRLSLRGKPSIEYYARALEHPWPNALAHHNYGIALLQAGDYDGAEKQFAAALRGIDTGQVYLALGTLADRRGDRKQAREWLEECLFRIPSSLAGWTRLARASSSDRVEELTERAQSWLDEEGHRQFIEQTRLGTP